MACLKGADFVHHLNPRERMQIMISNKITIKFILILTACVAFVPLSSHPVVAQNDPFQLIKTYDYQNRTGVEEVKAMLRDASMKKETAKYLHIEGVLDNLLANPNTTFAGKQEICRILWMYGTDKSIPVLSKLLLNPQLSDSARYALERNKSPLVDRSLRYALGKTTGNTLIGIINSLGDRRDSLSVNALKRYVRNSNPLVSEAAIAALGKIGTTSALACLLSQPVKTIPVYQAIVNCSYSLAMHGEKGQAEYLFEKIASSPWPFGARAEGLRGLEALHSSKTLDACLACMKVHDVDLQTIAASIAGSLPDPVSTKRCLAIWGSLPPYMQAAMLASMTDRRAKEASKIALVALKSADPTLRQVGIRAAGLLSGVSAVVPLANLVFQNDSEARRALADMKGKTVDSAIIYLANHSSKEMRAAMMSVLAMRANMSARITLMNAAQGSDPQIAVAALNALDQIGGQDDHPSLVALLASTKNDEVRDAAKNAVIAIGQRMNNRNEAIQPVLASLPNATPQGKAALMDVLAEIGGDDAFQALVSAAESKDDVVRSAAITALSESWTTPRPLPVLLNIAKTDANEDNQIEALRGYLRLIGQDSAMPASEKVSKIAEALQVAKRPEEKTLALSILKDCRTPSSVELAATMLDDPNLFPTAANTIMDLAAPQKRDRVKYPAVKGPETDAALTKIIQISKDPAIQEAAQKLKS